MDWNVYSCFLLSAKCISTDYKSPLWMAESEFLQFSFYSCVSCIPELKYVWCNNNSLARVLNIEISCFLLYSVPFNTEKLSGFYFELCIQMFTVHFYMLIFSSTYSLFDSFHSFTDVMISDYTIASETLKQQLTENLDENRLRVKQFLADSIKLHAGAIRWNDLK